MLGFKIFVTEGGNVKVGPKGQEVTAAPFSVTASNRSARKEDIHHALGAIHDKFHTEHGEHLFGKDKEHLKSGNTFTGSTHDLMGHHVADAEFAKHKSTVGDVDTQVSHDHKNKLESTLKTGNRFGKYTVAGTKKHGNEISAVMKHDNGEHHQFDFQGVHHPGSESERFLHSSSWEDTKKGFKGAHHKILLNAVGGEKHKFSISHGLRSRTDDSDEGVTHPTKIAHKLFGSDADHKKVHSFVGVSDLVKKHTPASQHQAIYNKFKNDVSKNKSIDSTAAIYHLKTHLGVKDEVNESANYKLSKFNYTTNSFEHHSDHGSFEEARKAARSLLKGSHGNQVRIHSPSGDKIPLNYSENVDESTDNNEHHAHMSFLGASPFTHMGHHADIGHSMDSAPSGKKFIGLSGKSDAFSDHEREGIANKQSAGKVGFKVEKSPGQTIARAYDSVKSHSGPKVLHMHFGHDRKDFAERLKTSVEGGKIPELEGHKFDKVHIHYPKDENRSHGFSGTKMRTAAEEGDLHTFKKHIGPSFDDKQSKSLMDRTKIGLLAGKIKVKR